MNKLLLVIDCQYDFINGSLGVKGSEEMMNKLSDYINNSHEKYVTAFATVDWHPSAHSSFTVNGGLWPSHCVQHSLGAAIYDKVLTALNKIPYFTVFTKGTEEDREEYSIFKNALSKEKLVNQINSLQIDEIDICGIALDYCVINTIKDALRELPNVKINVMAEYTPAIGDGEDAIKFIQETERTTWLTEE